MKYLSAFLCICLLSISCNSKNVNSENQSSSIETEKPDYAIAIHGGAGTILKANMSDEREKEYRLALNQALDIGERILKEGGSSLDAIEKTIHFMENSELFNAGKGAVFTHAGKNELDASIMYGKDQNAGAVGGVTNIKNPISAARAVMEKSSHVLLTGVGAEQFAKEQNLEIVDPSYFYTQRRFESMEKAKARDSMTEDEKHGTVGCVALDKDGNIAAGTSTGGMTNKKYQRIGDSPIIGAGTYADNATCAVSATGHGEYFIRYAVAHDIAARMAYGGKSLDEAARAVVMDKLVEKGGTGGVIAMDANGNISMPFNTEGMYRGFAKPGEREIAIYGLD